MAFNEVIKAPSQSELNSLKSKYRRLSREWDNAKYRFIDAIKEDDWEVLTSGDFLEIKELYLEKKRLYWKIHVMENPDDEATRVAYEFMNSMSHNECFDWLINHNLTSHRLIDEIRENPNFLEEVLV